MCFPSIEYNNRKCWTNNKSDWICDFPQSESTERQTVESDSDYGNPRAEMHEDVNHPGYYVQEYNKPNMLTYDKRHVVDDSPTGKQATYKTLRLPH